MDYMKYEKTFVMLTGQNDDFALRPEAPVTGHIKIETGSNKGAMRIGVQNLRYFDRKDYVYKLILFGKRTERTIHAIIGTVITNKFGSGETYFRFDPNDLEGKGYAISDFFYAIVAAVSVKNEKESLHPVLKGTLEMPRHRGEYEQAGGRGSRAVEKGFAEAAVKAAGADTDNDIEKADPYAQGAVAEQSKESRESREPERECFNCYYNQYVLESCIRMSEKGEYHDDIKPFTRDQTGATWKKIVNVNNFPLVSPIGRYFATKYRHYIFGSDGKRWYFGIPGRFMREEQPEEGQSGFVFWQPISGAEKLGATEENCPEENRKSAYGYWIVAVDMKTGDIEEV